MFKSDESLPEVALEGRNGFGGSFDGHLCPTRQRIIAPQKGIDIDHFPWVIINDNTTMQNIVVEECEKANISCSSILSVPNGYRTVCKQNYIVRDLIVLKSDHELDSKKFDIPTCCSCMLERT